GNSQFVIDYGMLPLRHIPISLVEKILFIGKSVCILKTYATQQQLSKQNEKVNSRSSTRKNSVSAIAIELIAKRIPSKDVQTQRQTKDQSIVQSELVGICVLVSLQHWKEKRSDKMDGISEDKKSEKSEVMRLTEEETFELAKTLDDLRDKVLCENKELNSYVLDLKLNEMREEIGVKLWHVIVHELHLLHHLKAMRDYFLLFKGEFWHCVLDECTSIPSFDAIPVTIATRDLNMGPFKSAATKFSLNLDSVSLEFAMTKFSTRRRGNIDLDSILTYGLCSKVNRKTDVLLQFQFPLHNLRQGSLAASQSCIHLPQQIATAAHGAKTKHNVHAGSCWMSKKVPILYGFECTFTVLASPHAQAFAFVVQHDRMDWWIEHENDIYGSDICNNALVLGFSVCSKDGTTKVCEVSLWGCDNKGNHAKVVSNEIAIDLFNAKV
ncbi:tubulin family protein, partial [Reticulomyxa filosa]